MMLEYNIEDIRHFFANDLRFLTQFKRTHTQTQHRIENEATYLMAQGIRRCCSTTTLRTSATSSLTTCAS